LEVPAIAFEWMKNKEKAARVEKVFSISSWYGTRKPHATMQGDPEVTRRLSISKFAFAPFQSL
jgi:hypothetical protein